MSKTKEELVQTAYQALLSICANRAGDQRAKEIGLKALESLIEMLQSEKVRKDFQK
jgi:hypothetical protein